jgi:hypothetical protein
VPRVLVVEDAEDIQNMVAFRLKKASRTTSRPAAR